MNKLKLMSIMGTRPDAADKIKNSACVFVF